MAIAASRERPRLLRASGGAHARFSLAVALVLGSAFGVPAGGQEIKPGETLRPALPGSSDERVDQASIIREGYIAALRTLSRGDRDVAAATAARVERSVKDDKGLADLRLLGKEERALVERLFAADVEVGPPVMLLQFDIARGQSADGEFQLASHALEIADTTARLYVDRRRDDASRRLVCEMFASFGAHALGRGLLTQALRLFERGVRTDARCAAAHLGLGTTYELLGTYGLAVAHFGITRTHHPKNHEAALRLGINLARLGRMDEALRALRVCLDDGVERWIAIVASQESARILIASRRLAEATRVLERSTARFPGNEGLLVELAHVLDLQGKRREARRTLYRLEEIPAGGGRSPRMEYGEWPSGELRTARSRFEDAAAERFAVLAESLREAGWSE